MGQLLEKLVIESRFDDTTKARHWVAGHARSAGFEAEVVFAIELALGEALANVIEHAYEGQPDQEIHLNLTIDETKLSLTIRDFGHKFDQAKYHPPNLSEAKEGGYGVYLIEQLMDEVRYLNPDGKGTQLNLIKYKSAPRKYH
jgi:serine/threonine-protein kinase RsbW